jgi:hypothetical protein
MDVIRVIVIPVIAAGVSGLALASCSSVSTNIPWVERLVPSSELSVTIDSNPQGAEARASYGGVCHTPCELSVPVTDQFTVTYTLDGYLPQTVAVRAIPAEKTALIDTTLPLLAPNPVLAELQPAPPPPPPEPPPPKKRKRP